MKRALQRVVPSRRLYATSWPRERLAIDVFPQLVAECEHVRVETLDCIPRVSMPPKVGKVHRRAGDERAVRPVHSGPFTADVANWARIPDLARRGSCGPLASDEHDAADNKHHCNEGDTGTDPGIPPLE